MVSGTGYFAASPNSASATITDNDTATANLSVTTQGDEAGPVDIVYTVTLSKTNDSGSAITFDLDDLLTGTASSGSDYTAIAANAQISVAESANTGTLTVAVTDDSLLELNTETLDAQIKNLAPRTEILADRALLYTEDSEHTIGAIADNGLEPEMVLARRSSLEDVFLRLTGRTLVE